MTRILLYERPFSSKLFREVISDVHGAADLTGISSYRGTSDIWSGDYLYDKSLDYKDPECLASMDDIICRDRSLVIMERSRAERIVMRFWNGSKRLFESKPFSYFYTLSIDCYEIDILLRLAEEFGVIPVSFLGSFINGYVWITLRGERNALHRGVTEQEASSVTDVLLNKEYLPGSETRNMSRASRDVARFYYRRKLIEMVYNPLQKVLHHDPDNLHYNIIRFPGLRLRDLYDDSYDSNFTSLADLAIDRARTIYYPMHLVPEATTSYWCKDIAKVGYENYVAGFIEHADPGIHFLVKEHPAMYGKRPLEFYRRLRGYDNVDLINPLVRSNDVLDLVDNVLVDDGTVGVEALIRGKRTLSLEENYYSSLHPNISVVPRVTLKEMARPLLDHAPQTFIADLLDGLFPSDYSNDKQQERCSADQLASGIRLYLAGKGGS